MVDLAALHERATRVILLLRFVPMSSDGGGIFFRTADGAKPACEFAFRLRGASPAYARLMLIHFCRDGRLTRLVREAACAHATATCPSVRVFHDDDGNVSAETEAWVPDPSQVGPRLLHGMLASVHDGAAEFHRRVAELLTEGAGARASVN